MLSQVKLTLHKNKDIPQKEDNMYKVTKMNICCFSFQVLNNALYLSDGDDDPPAEGLSAFLLAVSASSPDSATWE